MKTQIDYFLESIASHSKDCECSKCLKYTADQYAQEEYEASLNSSRENKYEQDFSNSTSPTGETEE